MKNILVLGSGVSGMNVALSLTGDGHKVAVWSRESTLQFPTSSYNAYAMWWPVCDPAQPNLERWACQTFDEFARLAEHDDTGIVMRTVMSLKTSRSEPWFSKLSGFRHARSGEISADYADAHVIDKAPVIDPTVYLPWLRKQLLARGVVFCQKTVADLSECPDHFDVVVNCTSLESRKLSNDQELYPSRFQVVTIKQNGFDKVVFDDEGPHRRACIVPHKHYIKLGTVADEHIEDLHTDPAATVDILQRCSRMVPGFKANLEDVISVARALRPERKTVRLERENCRGRSVIHNYGHDGMGYIIAVGAALEVAKLI